MRSEVEAVVDELKRLRQEGVSSVYLREETMSALREAVARQSGDAPAMEFAAPADDSPAPSLSELASTVPEPKKKAARKAAPAAAGLPDFVKPIPEPTPFTLPEGNKQKRWDWLKDKVLSDPVCNEHVAECQQVVLGVGDLEADIFFCGEAPGKDEAEQGEPFVGAAGQLLNRIISAMGLVREQVYIGNIMNWRPEHDKPYGDRKPAPVEMAYCLPYLRAQIEIVQPKVIVALGATAVDGLFGFGEGRGITKKRGQWRAFAGIPTILTFHPSYVLRQDVSKVKREIWEDMLATMEKVGLSISEKQRGYFQ